MILITGCKTTLTPSEKTKPEMVFVKGGEFLMGDVIEKRNKDALPSHVVSVDDFFIGKYEVTYAQYDAYARAKNIELPKDRGYGRGERAVVYINWYQAQDFCTYWGWRLPSEKEWEYAARAGGKHIRYSGTNDPDSLGHYAITDRLNLNFSYPVGRKKPNQIGLYDMSGNVFEMIGNFYQYYAYP
ncbi:MAG: SUMF1/EgtB/PvdO family nonheme iron enzyme, partial [Gracilimonas sp.]|nr:SUMF1/EgtB/PvdO family nonheme iron enzyme [Gracilimonas sp.]